MFPSAPTDLVILWYGKFEASRTARTDSPGPCWMASRPGPPRDLTHLNPPVFYYMINSISSIPAVLRCALSGNHPKIVEQWGDEAREYLRTRPGMLRAMQLEGFLLPPSV